MVSITLLQKKMADGSLTSLELVTGALATAEQKRHLNAFITVNHHPAVEQAKYLDTLREQGTILGQLHGIPVVIKDNIHVAGLPNTAGTPALKTFIPNQDAGVVERLKAAGAIIIGKSNMHELAYGITSDNHAFGAVGNAHNAKYIAGGSSGGTATAIAAGMAVAGLGTDTGGSSRIPAALNGIVGFRPTTGRYPSNGLTQISHTRDTVGPMGLSVNDVALLDNILSNESSTLEDIQLSELRLGIPRAYFYENLEPVVSEKMEQLLETLQHAGVKLLESDIENVGELNEKIGFPLVIYETKSLIQTYLADNLPSKTIEELVAAIASPDVKNLMTLVISDEIPESVYLEALNIHRSHLQESYKNYFADKQVDAILFPTTALTARPIEGSLETVELNGNQVPTFPAFIRNTDPASNAGIPGLTLPLAVSLTGLPIGVEIDGPEGSDRQLLAIGVAIEKLIHQHKKRK
jgi:mandelamide amidase